MIVKYTCLVLAFLLWFDLDQVWAIEVPHNAHPDYTGRSWTCDNGFFQRGQTCIPVKLPANSRLDYTGHSWTCDNGFFQRGQTCIPIKLPANSRLDYTGHSWTCDSGFFQRGQSCETLTLPNNAELDYTGHSWKCAHGFRRVGNGCEKFSVPENAQVDFTGNDFACNQNYKRVSDRCAPMTQEEIRYQNYIIVLSRLCGGSKSVDVEGTCGGDSVSGEIEVCQRSKEASGELEFDSGLTTQFDGTWTSASEFEGTDGFGNSCELELD
jgi:hypothetical protein